MANDAPTPTFQERVERWFRPRVDPARLEAALKEARHRQAPPVLWLLGKTQSGKSSLVRALTGDDEATVGSGFRPCTAAARLYDFPPLTPVVRFLDTRGLGERAYDPTEDLAFCEAQSQLVVGVMRVDDPDASVLRGVLEQVRRRHPDWPLLMVQTCLHRVYPPGTDHFLPYPFGQPDWRVHVPDGVTRLIDHQRRAFEGLPGHAAVHWAVVDLTHPEDGFEPLNYGVEALWSGIEQVATLGLVALLRGDASVRGVFEQAAQPHIVGAALAAAALGALPVVDLALLPALQWKLVHTLASLFGMQWTRQNTLELAGLLGGGVVLQAGLGWMGRTVLKAVPAWGTVAGAVWGASSSAALTYAVGRSVTAYLQSKRDGQPIDAEQLRHVYADAFARGRALARVAAGERCEESRP